MATFETVRVAAVQATPVILDAEASVEKAVRLIGEAAAEGARLAVLPETFVPVYPSNAWARQAASFGGSDELWERLWENSVDVPGPLVDRLVDACRAHGVHVAIGVNERESERPGSLYNTLLLLGPDGVELKHRKLVPTHQERLFHAFGAGDDLDVADTPLGRIGGLVCWENRMPLARWSVYRQGPQIWIAPTADDSDGWLATVRHIAIESGAFVISVPQYIPRSAFPDDFPLELPDQPEFGRGGAAIVEPTGGEVIAGPLYGEEGMVVADCDLRRGLHAKRWFDAVGHYSAEAALGGAERPAPHAASQQDGDESA
jgi:nitrilase